jgi:prepilin-type N-terminal cleavage/methylation domain-containing protein
MHRFATQPILMKSTSSNIHDKRLLPHSRQRGMTLVEVSVAVAVSALLLGIAVSLMVRLQRWDLRFRDDATTNSQVALLGETIRGDIRAATDVALASEHALIITGPNQRQMRYELTSPGCQRIVEQPVGKEERRELYRLQPELVWTLDSTAGSTGPNILVTLEQRSSDPTGKNMVRLVASANRGADLSPDLPKIQQENLKPDK